MNHVSPAVTNTYVLVLLDDILVYIKTSNAYEKRLCEVFECLYAYKVHVRLKKCAFGKPWLYYLNRILGSGQPQVN